jgi:alpha-tubulin suppressor-like RCC1 family protein
MSSQVPSKKIFVWGRSGAPLGVTDVLKDYAEPVDISSKFEDNKIVQISAGSQHCLALTESGSVYSWGQNHSGQLAQGDVADRLEPEIIKTVTLWNATLNRKVVKVCVGELHSLMATSDGMLFAVGDNNDTNLGIGPRSDIVVHPRPVLIPDGMYSTSQATSSSNGSRGPTRKPGHSHSGSSASEGFGIDINTLGRHSLAVNNDGKVFGWGSSNHGQLGLGTYESSFVPRHILSLEGIKIVRVACGWSHSLCLSDDGRVFVFGEGEDGKLGLGNLLDFVVPFTINSFISQKITIETIAAGHFHSAAVDSHGHLYTWGSGTCGVLGHGNNDHQLVPKRVNVWLKLKKDDNERSDGSPKNAQTASKPPVTPKKPSRSEIIHDTNDSEEAQGLVFTPPTTPSKQNKQASYSPSISSAYVGHDHSNDWHERDAVVSVACGAFHMLVATREGLCFSWGKGDTYALGHGNTTDLTLPRQIATLKDQHVSMVACGINHSIAIADVLETEQDEYENTRTPKHRPVYVPMVTTSPSTASTPPTVTIHAPMPQLSSSALSVPGKISSAPGSAKSGTSTPSNPASTKIVGLNANSAVLAVSPNASESPIANAQMLEYAKNAAVARELGSTTTAMAFEKAIYGDLPHGTKRGDVNELPSSTPSSQRLNSSGDSEGATYEPAPVSKPMRISPAQRRKALPQHEEDFPNVMSTWVHTAMDTKEYSIASVRVDAEVAQLRYMLASGGSKPAAAPSRKNSGAPPNQNGKRFKRSEANHAKQVDLEESSSSDPLMGDSSSDNDEFEVPGSPPSEITDPKEMMRRTKRDMEKRHREGPSGLAVSPTQPSQHSSSGSSSVLLNSEGEISKTPVGSSLDHQTAMFSPFLQDRGSVPSSPLFRGSSASKIISTTDEDNDEAPEEIPNFATDSAQNPTIPPVTSSPLKFGISYRIRDSLILPPDHPDFSQIVSTNAIDLLPQLAQIASEVDSSAVLPEATSSEVKGGSKKKKTSIRKKLASMAAGGAANGRFSQLFESMFRNANAPVPERLDATQHGLDKASAAQESVADYWLTVVMPNWESMKRSSSIKRLWRRGIPANIRGVVWSFLIRNELFVDFNLYDAASKSAKMRFQLWLNGAHDSRTLGQSVFHVIDVDVPRTHPETKLFKPGGPFYGDLVNLLHVYSAFDRDMSYVQGMSYLAAFFVTHCVDPFTAFRCFANLLNTHFFRSLFKMNLTQVLRHMSAYELLFERHLPKLFAHFQRLCITPEQYLLDWFMTCFSRAFSLRTSSRIFDCLIIEGEVFLYRTALSILKLSEATLLAADFESLLPLFRHIARELDEDKLFTTISSIKVPKEVRKYIQKITRETVS